MRNKTFSISVDVEDFFYNKLFSDAYLGKVNNEYLGVPKFIEIAEKLNVKVTFFVDVDNFEELVPKKIIRETCQIIQESSHELAIHTHPPSKTLAKRKKTNYNYDRILRNYDYKSQYEFISNAASKIEKWTKYWPESHRAGSYGINEDTYIALNKAGIKNDSSVFWGKQEAGLEFLKKEKNNINPFQYNGINILPVTNYFLNLKILLFQIGLNKKTDIEWCSINELSKIANLKEIEHIDLMMHSDSLINVFKSSKNNYFINNLKEMILILNKNYTPVLINEINYSSYRKVNTPKINYSIFNYSFSDLYNIYLTKLK